MVKLLDTNSVEREVSKVYEMKDRLDKIYNELYIKNILNIRKVVYNLDKSCFENTRQLNYYYNKLKNKLDSLHGIMRHPYNETFYSFIIDRPADYSVVIKIFELSLEIYDSKNGNCVYNYNPTMKLLDEVNNDWKFFKERPISESPVIIEVENSKTFTVNEFDTFRKSIREVIKNANWLSVNDKALTVPGVWGCKIMKDNFILANKLAASDYKIDASKYERSTIMIMKLELREDAFDLNKPIIELHKDALEKLMTFSNAYGLGILDHNTWINTTLEYFDSVLVVHFIKLEENINNNDDMHIERIISNAINNLQNPRNLHGFIINRLMVEQDVNIFVSEDHSLTSHKKYEIARDFTNNEYIVVKPEDSVYPDLENMCKICESKNDYVSKVVASSVTGADEYFNNFHKIYDSSDNCNECCDECEE